MNKDLTDRIAVLLINLGTPEKPYKEEVREYLKEFLSDKDVIRLPRLIWLPILHGFVLPFRPKKSARLYQKVWTERGSPLLFNTYDQSRSLQKKLDDYKPGKYHVDVAMRYGKPSISEKLNDIANKGGKKIIIIPLFPQFSTTTTRSIVNKVLEICKKDLKSSSLKTKIIEHFHDDELYIKASVEIIKKFQETHGAPDKLLFSFHGIPKSYIGPDEPYHTQCLATAKLIAQSLKLNQSSYEIVFQSRFGMAEWIKPYLSDRLVSLPTENKKNIQVYCPGFVSDCLETLEEINNESRELFLNSSGEKFSFIPCMNSDKIFIECLENLVIRKSEGF